MIHHTVRNTHERNTTAYKNCIRHNNNDNNQKSKFICCGAVYALYPPILFTTAGVEHLHLTSLINIIDWIITPITSTIYTQHNSQSMHVFYSISNPPPPPQQTSSTNTTTTSYCNRIQDVTFLASFFRIFHIFFSPHDFFVYFCTNRAWSNGVYFVPHFFL